ncbi:MAG TPA: hypothetical protein VNA65_10470 [Candidatus Dormibacteraeota bacterium]|nr:hypothetical protein [Candidatus Dormibacteraeota bacterium]
MARKSNKSRLEVLVETMGPPISTARWSPDFVSQTLEVLPVGIRDGHLFWLKPLHADSLRVGLAPASKPAEVVLEAMRWYPLEAVLVHSTSWRHEDDRIILTYVAVVKPPDVLPPESLVELPVGRAALARGEAMSAPKAIGVEAVLEHAMRHLAWLINDDAAVTQALPEWREVLAQFEPEPFRALS